MHNIYIYICIYLISLESMEDEKNSVKVEEKGSLETESDQKLHKEDDKFQRLGGPEEISIYIYIYII